LLNLSKRIRRCCLTHAISRTMISPCSSSVLVPRDAPQRCAPRPSGNSISMLDLIPASVHDRKSVGPSIRPICTRCCFTMMSMIQVCSNFINSECLSSVLVRMKSGVEAAARHKHSRKALRTSKVIFGRVRQLLAINAHKMAPRTGKRLQERARDNPTKGLLWSRHPRPPWGRLFLCI
jgi:hypothetical protein